MLPAYRTGPYACIRVETPLTTMEIRIFVLLLCYLSPPQVGSDLVRPLDIQTLLATVYVPGTRQK